MTTLMHYFVSAGITYDELTLVRSLPLSLCRPVSLHRLLVEWLLMSGRISKEMKKLSVLCVNVSGCVCECVSLCVCV